jgi:hypothetical protein
VRWRDFDGWFARQRQAFKGIEAQQAFEEIRGVLAASPTGVLSREEYRALGARQSIFGATDRERLYDLFERYCGYLAQSGLFDATAIAHEWRALAAPRYDFLALDEVQDLTGAQLALVLKTLRAPGQFLLCGDSNQIVHPNFFSWAWVKTFFWSDPELAARQELGAGRCRAVGLRGPDILGSAKSHVEKNRLKNRLLADLEKKRLNTRLLDRATNPTQQPERWPGPRTCRLSREEYNDEAATARRPVLASSSMVFDAGGHTCDWGYGSTPRFVGGHETACRSAICCDANPSLLLQRSLPGFTMVYVFTNGCGVFGNRVEHSLVYGY